MKTYDHIATISVLIALVLNLTPNWENNILLSIVIFTLCGIGLLIVFLKEIKILK